MLCITPLLHCANHEFEEAWGFSKYPVKEYLNDANQLTELPEEKVMNPFWINIKNSCCQEKKILTLIQILHELPDGDYASRRYNVAAAVYAGIDVPKLQSLKKLCRYLLLSNTVEYGDYPLTELLLKNKASALERNDDSSKPVIYDARTAQLAKLLIDHGALKENWPSYGTTLLHQAMWLDYEPALISLYKECGIDPLARNSIGWTPLIELVSLGVDDESDEEADNTELTKAFLLLQNMPKGKVTALLTSKVEHRRATVFDFIEREKHSFNKSKICKLNALRTYFIDTLNSSDPIVSNSEEKEKIVD
jgi:hypothetical protein